MNYTRENEHVLSEYQNGADRKIWAQKDPALSPFSAFFDCMILDDYLICWCLSFPKTKARLVIFIS